MMRHFETPSPLRGPAATREPAAPLRLLYPDLVQEHKAKLDATRCSKRGPVAASDQGSARRCRLRKAADVVAWPLRSRCAPEPQRICAPLPQRRMADAVHPYDVFGSSPTMSGTTLSCPGQLAVSDLTQEGKHDLKGYLLLDRMTRRGIMISALKNPYDAFFHHTGNCISGYSTRAPGRRRPVTLWGKFRTGNQSRFKGLPGRCLHH